MRTRQAKLIVVVADIGHVANERLDRNFRSAAPRESLLYSTQSSQATIAQLPWYWKEERH